MNVIEIEELTQRFDDLLVLDDISLQVAEDEIVSILGPSGCGKSTLLRVIADLIEPTEGTVRVNGETGMMFQEARLLKWRTVGENIRLGADLMDRELREDRIEGLLEMVELGGYADRYPAQLSGGERQRVALARTLATEPEVLLMDEPVSALDAATREALQDTFLEVHQRTGKATVFVTHSIEEAVKMGDRVLVFSGKPTHITGEVDMDQDHDAAVNAAHRLLRHDDA